jgi:hypothetical protein
MFYPIQNRNKLYDREYILNSGRDIYYYNNNGNRYEGVIKNNMREGSGICRYFESETESICIYIGDWKNNKRDGRGIEFHKRVGKRTTSEGSSRYEGEFKNDMREGKGNFIYNKNLKEDSGIIGNFDSGRTICNYEGEWKNNKRNGEGVEVYGHPSNSNRYEGNFKNDVRDGEGAYFYQNVLHYDGEWKNGLKEGIG